MKLNVCLVTFLVLLNSAAHGSSIYFQPTYCSSYIAPQGRAVIASNAPSSQQQSAQNGNAKRYWAVNQGSESAGTVTAYFGAPGLQDTPLGGNGGS